MNLYESVKNNLKESVDTIKQIYTDDNITVYEDTKGWDFAYDIENKNEYPIVINFPEYDNSLTVENWIGLFNDQKYLVDEILRGAFEITIPDDYAEENNLTRESELKESSTDQESADFLNSDIQVYDLAKSVESKHYEGKVYTTHTGDKRALIKGADGKYILADYEAVRDIANSENDEVKIYVSEKSEPDDEGHFSISVFPTGTMTTTIKEIMDEAPVETMKARDFFTKYNYNDRCSRNFGGMLDNIKGIYRTNEGETLKETSSNGGIPDENYDIAEYIDKRCGDRIQELSDGDRVLRRNDFDELFEEGLRKFYKLTDKDMETLFDSGEVIPPGETRSYPLSDIETDVRGILSFNGYETVFEPEDNGAEDGDLVIRNWEELNESDKGNDRHAKIVELSEHFKKMADEVNSLAYEYDELDDEDDVFAGTADSYAVEVIGQRVYDLISNDDILGKLDNDTINNIINDIMNDIVSRYVIDFKSFLEILRKNDALRNTGLAVKSNKEEINESNGYYNWKDDIEDVEATEENDDIWYAVAENMVENGDYKGYDVMEVMSDIIHLWKIDKNSMLYDYLLKWYGSEEELLKKVRDVYNTNDAIYFVTGSGYAFFDNDLLGGNADGTTEKKFEEFMQEN